MIMGNTGCGFQSLNLSRCKMCCFNHFFEFAAANTKSLLALIIIGGSFTFVYWFILVPLFFTAFKEKRLTQDWSQNNTVAFFLTALVLWILLMFLIAAVWYYCSRNIFKKGEKAENTPIIAKEPEKLEHMNEKVRQTLGIDENLENISKNVLRQSRGHWDKLRKDVNKLELRKSPITPLPEYSPEAKNNIFTFSPDDTNVENKRASSPFQEYLHLVQIDSPTSPTLSFEYECMKELSEFDDTKDAQDDREQTLTHSDLEEEFDQTIPEGNEDNYQKRPKSCIYDVPKKIKSLDSVNNLVLREEIDKRSTYKIHPEEIFAMDEELAILREGDSNQEHPGRIFVKRERELTRENSDCEEEEHPPEIEVTMEQELAPFEIENKDEAKKEQPTKIFSTKEKKPTQKDDSASFDDGGEHPGRIFVRKEKELTRKDIENGDEAKKEKPTKMLGTKEKKPTQEESNDDGEEHPGRIFVKKEKELTREDIKKNNEGKVEHPTRIFEREKNELVQEDIEAKKEHPTEEKGKELSRGVIDKSEDDEQEHPGRIFVRKEKDHIRGDNEIDQGEEHPAKALDRRENEHIIEGGSQIQEIQPEHIIQDDEEEHPGRIFVRKEKDLIRGDNEIDQGEEHPVKLEGSQIQEVQPEHIIEDSAGGSQIQEIQPKKKFGRKESKMFLGEIGKTGSVLSELHVDVSPDGRLLQETAVVMGRCEVLTVSPKAKE